MMDHAMLHIACKPDCTDTQKIQQDNHDQHMQALKSAANDDARAFTLVCDNVSLVESSDAQIDSLKGMEFDAVLCGDHDPGSFFHSLKDSRYAMDFHFNIQDTQLNEELCIRRPSFCASCILYSREGAKRILQIFEEQSMPPLSFCYKIQLAAQRADIFGARSITQDKGNASVQCVIPTPEAHKIVEHSKEDYDSYYIGFGEHSQEEQLYSAFGTRRFSARRPSKQDVHRMDAYAKWQFMTCGIRHDEVHFTYAGALGLLTTSYDLWKSAEASGKYTLVFEGNAFVTNFDGIKYALDIAMSYEVDYLVFPHTAKFATNCRQFNADVTIATTATGGKILYSDTLFTGTKCYIISPRFASHMRKTYDRTFPNIHIDALLMFEAFHPSGVAGKFRACRHEGSVIEVRGRHHIKHEPPQCYVKSATTHAVCNMPLGLVNKLLRC